MIKIKYIKTAHMRNDEHFQFNTEFKDLVTQETPEKLGIMKFWYKYLPCYSNEDTALKKFTKSATTTEIKKADKERDNTFRGLADVINGFVRHYDIAISTAAKRLKVLFDSYGNLVSKPFSEETSGIYNMLQELKGVYGTDVQVLGLPDWVLKLEADNNAFEALVKARGKEIASKTQLKMKETRTETDIVYNEIVDFINAAIIVKGEDDYKNFVNNLNFFIDKSNNAMAIRSGKSKTKKKTDDNSEEKNTEN